MKESYPLNQLRDYSALFSRNEVQKWLKNDFKNVDIKIRRHDMYSNFDSYMCYLKYAYNVLVEHYPNEYVYKNEFISRWLISALGTSDSIVFNEFRVGKAIADLVMFNGISKVFEIKTDLDNDSRLHCQVSEYKKLFNEVYIIVSSQNVEKYMLFDKHIGIISYNEDKQFSVRRKALRNKVICKSLLMEVLHTKEYLDIALSQLTALPQMNDFDKFDICKSIIEKIPNKILNNLFVSTMKSRRVNNNFSETLNREFNQLLLALNLSESQKNSIFSKLSTKFTN